jgi:phage RecT family recombinase
MSTAVAIPNSTTPIERQAADSVLGILRKYSKNIKGVLPAHLSGDRCAFLVMNSIAQNPKLADCTPVSFLNSVMLAANLGLEIRKNSCYLIPYGRECQLIVDYHGKMELARRAGVGAIHAELVREGDLFEYGFDKNGPVFEWRPCLGNGEVKAVFVTATINGSTQFTVMATHEIEKIRARAKAGCAVDFQHFGKTVKGLSLADIRALDIAKLDFKSPYRVPWVTDWDRMALKTVVHRAANSWPMSAALLTAQEIDVAHETGAAMPSAEGLSELVLQIDPADNKPMVTAGDPVEVRIKALASTQRGMEALKKQGVTDPDEIVPEDRERVLAGMQKFLEATA